MRRMLAVAAILHALVSASALSAGALSLGALSLASSAAWAGFIDTGPGLTGNDSGGIIQATPDTVHTYKEIAVAHCAQWRRYAGITSVHRKYGDYIGFRCVYDHRFDARKLGLSGAY
jgi:hypothetical protein